MNYWTEVWFRLPITATLAIASAVVSFGVYQWLNYRLHIWIRNRLQSDLAKYAQKHGQPEVALILSVRDDIAEAAKRHLKGEDREEIQTFQVHQPTGFGSEEHEWIAFLEKIKKEMRTIREMGVSRIYLFSNLPVAMASLAGATLTNGPEVVIHHYSGGNYLPVARLTPETIRL